MPTKDIFALAGPSSPSGGVWGAAWSGIAKHREYLEEQKRQKKLAAQKRLRQMQLDRLEELRKEGVMRALPTADPNADHKAFQKRANEAFQQVQRRSFGQYLPGLLGSMNASYAQSAKDNDWVERQNLERDIRKRAATPEFQRKVASDPLFEYQRLCRSMGKDKVGERMANIKAMWDTYSLMYDGSDVIWELTKSPFAMPEIKNMLEEMNHLMYQDYDRYTFRENTVDELWVKWRDSYGMKPAQYEPFRQLFEAQQKNEMPSQWERGDKLGAILTMSIFLPMPGLGWVSALKNTTNTVRALTTAGRALTTGERLVQTAKTIGTGAAEIAAKATVPAAKVLKFGGKFETAMLGIGGLAEIEAAKDAQEIADKTDRANKALELASSPVANLLTSELGLDTPTPFEEITELRQNLAAIANEPTNRDGIKQLQTEWKELGIGTDLDADGVLSWEWQEVIISAAEDGIRAVFDEQRLAMEEGDADHWAEVNGNMDDPYWKDVFARRAERQALSDQAKIENYSKWMWYESAGIPRNSLEAKALGRRLAENGFIQALYGGLLHTALTIGQVVDATASAVNLSVRQSKDKEYQRLAADLNAYIDSLELDHVVGGYSGQPAQSNEGFALMQAGHPDGPLYSDPVAQEKLAALKLRQAQLINEDYDADILETLGLTFGTSPQRMRQFELDHPDIVHAFTAGVWIATAKVNPVGRIYRGAFKPTVRPNMAAFLDSARAKRIVGRVTNYLVDGDAGRAVSYIKGTAAGQLLNNWWTLSGKTAKRVSAKSQIIMDVARDIIMAVDEGAPERVATILKGADDAVVDAVVAKVQGPIAGYKAADVIYDYAPVTIEGISGKTWYHGTGRSVAPDSMTAGRSAENLVGPGVYLTDSAPIALSYSKARAGKDGSVWATQLEIPASKIIDLDAKPTAGVQKIVNDFLSSEAEHFTFDDAAAGLKSDTLLTTYQRIRKAISAEGLTVLGADEVMGSLNYRLIEAGFQAMKHMGGQFVGKKPHNVLVLLDPFGELGPVGVSPRFTSWTPPPPVRVGPATRAEIRGWVGSVAERAMAEKYVSQYIAKQHNRGQKVISDEVLNTRLMERFAVEYAKGADVFPYLRDNKILPPNRILSNMTKQISRIPNEWLRGFMTKWSVGLITRAPTAEIELRGLNTLDRVYDAAMLISQDAAWAWNFRNRWATAKSQGQYLKLADQLTAKFDSKFIGRNSHTDMGIRDRVAQWVGREYESGGQALAPEPFPIPARAADAQMLTQWTIPKQPGRPARIAQALPDTVYQQYLVSLHRSALWAPYRLTKLDGIGSYFLRGPEVVRNIYRGMLGGAHKISTPLRQWTVAMGAPLLFQKHAITDSFRTYMETGATSLLEAAGLKGITVRGHTIVPKIRNYHARRMDTILSEISPSLRDEILYNKARVHASEAQWLSGTGHQVYRPKTIRDKNGRVTDLDGSAHALRRILEGEAFKQYAAGGAPAVEAWLLTPAGKRFMREGGWTKRAKDIITEQYHGRVIPEGMLKADAIMERARADYMEDIVQREFMRLDTAMPGIMPTLKDMAINERVWDINRIKKLIEDNPNDNAVLSMPAHTYASSTVAGYITGKAMSANKWNRDVVFDHIFLREFNKLKREGIEANNAAQTAATIAELNTARIHFDLSNALAVEARHRWFAWFATKHRLFGTYMMKLAIERPTIAAVVPEIMHWMEERNEKQGVGEFDKYDLIINRADGSQWRFNLAPYMWFAEFPLESSAAIALEQTAEWFGDKYMGFSIPASPTPFGLTFTRADSLFLNLYYVITADNAVKEPDFFLETGAAQTQEQAERKAEESLTEWLNSLGESQRLRWRRLINNARAYSIARGENWTALQAFNEIKWGILTGEFMKCCKLYSGRKMGADELEVERLLRQYADLTAAGDEEAARELMQTEPALAAAFNATMDPVEKQQLDEGWRIFNQFRDDCTKALEAADEGGTLINRYDDIMEEFGGNVDRLINPVYEGGDNSVYNPTFARYFGSMRNISTPQEFLDRLGFLMPVIPPASVWEQGRAKTAAEKEEHKERALIPAFKEALLSRGLVYGSDSSQPLYQQLKQELVDDPLIEWSGESEYRLAPYKAENAARYLAREGETGVTRAGLFLDLVKDRTLQQWVAKGIGTSGLPTSPFMALLTSEQAGLLDWTRAPGVADAWREWAEIDWLIKYARKMTPRTEEGKEGFGVSPSSTLYKQMKADNLTPLEEKLKAAVDGFNDEYDFSKLRLHERLIVLGVGSGGDTLSKQYAQFLSVCTDYWTELDQADNPSSKEPGISPVSQAARPIWEKYVKKVAKLAYPTGDPDKPSEWWQFFRGTFGISKFGFTRTWQIPDKTVTALLWGDEDTPADETEEYWYK